MQKTEVEYLSYKKAMEILGLNSYKTLTVYIKAGLPVIEVPAQSVSKELI